MSLEHWVVFRLASREYALRLEHVVEVLRMVTITPLPEAPAWVAGVINLRGQVISVTDLRTRLGLPPRAPGLSTPIIVVKVNGRPWGLIADEAVEVLGLPAEALTEPDTLAEAAPATPERLPATLRADGRLLVVFDLERWSGAAESLALAGPG